VNLIGEHTDYNEGFALPFAIEQGCAAAVEHSSTPGITITSAQRPHDTVALSTDDVRPGAGWISGASGWAAYAAGIGWALAELGYLLTPTAGLRIHLDSDVPIGAGLSSSAAVGCSVAAAMAGLLELDLDRRDIAKVAIHAETRFVGAPTGGMDQFASALAQARHVLFYDGRTLQTETIPFDTRQHELTTLVVNSRAEHRLVSGEYRERRESCAAAAAELGVPALRDIQLEDLNSALSRLSSDRLKRRVRHVVTECARVLEVVGLLRSGALADIGPVLVESHRSMAEDFQLTVPEIDDAVQALLGAGALGARMTGGGFGGCVIALVESRLVEHCVEEVGAVYADRGYRPPICFTALAGDGVRLR
jgi:galactokinase